MKVFEVVLVAENGWKPELQNVIIMKVSNNHHKYGCVLNYYTGVREIRVLKSNRSQITQTVILVILGNLKMINRTVRNEAKRGILLVGK